MKMFKEMTPAEQYKELGTIYEYIRHWQKVELNHTLYVNKNDGELLFRTDSIYTKFNPDDWVIVVRTELNRCLMNSNRWITYHSGWLESCNQGLSNDINRISELVDKTRIQIVEDRQRELEAKRIADEKAQAQRELNERLAVKIANGEFYKVVEIDGTKYRVQ